jgi:hypothetical protein
LEGDAHFWLVWHSHTLASLFGSAELRRRHGLGTGSVRVAARGRAL